MTSSGEVASERWRTRWRRPTTLARPGVASSAALRASVRASRVGAFGRSASTTTTAESGAIRREVLDRAGRAKLNAADDRGWYQVPRMCTHVDDAFLAQLTQLYRERVPPGGRVFDMCSSWISHLPPEVEYEEVVGHSMNAEELAANRRLSRFFVKNLNENPTFAAADKSFDAVLCCVSVQYLQRPEEVFAEVYRILKPGGVCVYLLLQPALLRESHRELARRQRIQSRAARQRIFRRRRGIHQARGDHGGWLCAGRLHPREAPKVRHQDAIRSLLRRRRAQKLQTRA